MVKMRDEYISADHGFDFITFNGCIEKNKYARDGVAKFIGTKKKNKFVFSSCANFLNIFNRPWDLFVLLFNDTKQVRASIEKQFSNLIPLYAVFDDSYILISKLASQQIYELVDTCNPNDISRLYIKEMGAVLKTPKNKLKLNYDYHGIRYPKLQEVKTDGTEHILPNNHGWLSTNTELCLKFVLENVSLKHDNIIVVELGSWLGSSACEILKTMKSGSLYCFDHFQNIALTDYNFEKPHPLDKFWMTVPRYETFCRNIAPYISKNKRAYTIKYDVRKSIGIMKYNFITPNVLYIDAIKSRDFLFEYLQKLFQFSPKTIVVGDDYVFQSVKDAVSAFMRSNHSNSQAKYYLYTTDECYILGQGATFQYYGICQNDCKNDLNNRAGMYIEKQIKSDPVLEAVNNLHRHNYDAVCSLLTKYKINVNKPLIKFNNNTFYTLVIIQIYSQKRKSVEKVRQFILNNIDKHPKKIKNSLFLTWQDYIDHNIVF